MIISTLDNDNSKYPMIDLEHWIPTDEDDFYRAFYSRSSTKEQFPDIRHPLKSLLVSDSERDSCHM